MSTLHLYMVDDDNLQGKILELKLKKIFSGLYKQHTFPDGESCIAALSNGDKSEKPDVLILDYFLPDMNGLEILKKVRQFMPDLPVIVYSAQQEMNTTIDLFKEGIFDYVIKGENSNFYLVEAVNRIYRKKLRARTLEVTKKGTLLVATVLLVIIIISVITTA